MQNHKIVSRDQWLLARKEHLAKEKEFTKLRDQLSQARRDLPWVKVDKAYLFASPEGPVTLADLFQNCSQLIIYHFMYGPEWAEGCPSCSFWADNADGIGIHLNHRDINLVFVSRAQLETLEAYKKRMGWSINWVSSHGSDFNYDYQVSFSAEQLATGDATYNYKKGTFSGEEAPGISVFYKNEEDEIFHTYACFSRGLDMLNGAYHYMDIVPKGRDEAGLDFTMAWLRRRDQYRDNS